MSPDDAFVRPSPEWVPRLIVIDGCNVGRSACGLGREAVSCAGLLSVVRWLLLRDFECVIFLPVVYNNPTNNNATHVHVLSKIEELGLVTFTPARTSSGNRRAFINYDDLYLMTLAERHGGCVLSGDKFKDILAQPAYSEFHEVIMNRVIDCHFLFLTHDVVHFGDDLFYRAVPELFISEDVLTRASSISRKIYCSPEDPTYSRVVARRSLFTRAKRKECLIACDNLIYELCEREAIRPLRMNTLPAIQNRNYTLERVIPYLEELQIIEDDTIWQPDDLATIRGYNYSLIECFNKIEDDKLPLISLSDSRPTATLHLASQTQHSDSCEIVEQQLMTTQEDTPLDLEQIEAVVMDSPGETLEAEEEIIEPKSGSENATKNLDEKRRQHLFEQLQIIFPRDIVETVLTMNASCNLDYLAEQCLLQMNQ